MNFKSRLVGGGARANQFSVTLNPPRNCNWIRCQKNNFINQNWTYCLDRLSLKSLSTLEVDSCLLLVTEHLKQWTTTILNDTDFAIRDAMERWMSAMNDFQTKCRTLTNVAEYTSDIVVRQLDARQYDLKTYISRNCFPVAIAPIDLNMDTASEIETFDVT